MTALAIVFALVLTSACKSIDPTPFQAFQASLVQLQEASDKVWDARVKAEEARAYGKPEEAAELMRSDVLLLSEVEDSYAWRMEKAPLYFVMEKNRKAFRDLNQAYVDYAALLVSLTGGELTSPERFEELASSLNANVRSSMDSMKANSDDKSIGIVSTAAAELFKGFIAKKQRSALQRALAEAQPALEAFAEECETTLDLLATDSWTAYSNYTETLPKPNPDAGEEGRTKELALIKALMVRNRAHIAELESLQALARSYQLVPKAHAELKKSLQQEGSSLTWIQYMYGEAQRLKKQADELAKAPDGGKS